MHMFGGYGGMGFGMLFMIIFWGFIIALLFSLARNRSGGASTAKQETSLDIVKKRFASGEINKEEFEKLKRELA